MKKLTQEIIDKARNGSTNEWFSYIAKHVELSEDFIREFQDKVNWTLISDTQKLSENFIMENLHKLNIQYLFKSEHNKDREWSDSLILLFKFQGFG